MHRCADGLRAIVLIGLIGAVIMHTILRRLLAIVDTVRAGDLSSSKTHVVSMRSHGAWPASKCCGWRSPRSHGGVGTRSSRRLVAASWLAILMLFVLSAYSRKARACAPTSKGRSDMAILVRLDEQLHARRMTLTELARARRHHPRQPVDPEDRQGQGDPLLHARSDLHRARVRPATCSPSIPPFR